MTNKELVEGLYKKLHHACGSPDHGLIRQLKREKTKFDSARLQRLRTWYQSLSAEQQTLANHFAEECADMCLFSLLTVLDGASLVESDAYLELRLHEKGAPPRIVTSGADDFKGEYLHDLVGEVTRKAASQ